MFPQLRRCLGFDGRFTEIKTMFTFIVVPTILIVVIVSLLVRLVLRPLWNPYRLRRPYFGPYGYYGYGMGYRRHWFPGRGLLSILLLVTLERLFGRRW